MTDNTEQPADTEGEWRISTYDESVILATGDARVIARCGSPAIAAQIVSDHKAAKSQALLVEALTLARKTLVICAEDDGFAPEDFTAVRHIDAALKAAGVEEK